MSDSSPWWLEQTCNIEQEGGGAPGYPGYSPATPPAPKGGADSLSLSLSRPIRKLTGRPKLTPVPGRLDRCERLLGRRTQNAQLQQAGTHPLPVPSA